MKTQMLKIKNVLFVLVASISMWSCSQKSSGNKNTPVAPIAGYTVQNGICYNSSMQMVDMSLCNSMNGGAYTLQNGNCVQTANGQMVPLNYCQSQTNTGYTNVNGVCIQTATNQPVQQSFCSMTGTQGQACYGTYTYRAPNGTSETGQCNGQNCRGYTLIDSMGRTVMCQ